MVHPPMDRVNQSPKQRAPVAPRNGDLSPQKNSKQNKNQKTIAASDKVLLSFYAAVYSINCTVNHSDLQCEATVFLYFGLHFIFKNFKVQQSGKKIEFGPKYMNCSVFLSTCFCQ